MLRVAGCLVVAALLATGAFADRVQGNWEGRFTSSNVSGPVSAKIIAEGDGNYRALVEARPDGGETHRVELLGKGNGEVAALFGAVSEERGAPSVTARIADGRLAGEVIGLDEEVTFELTRVEKKSPTLGATPPEGAVVLFDGTNMDKWKAVPDKWSLGDGAMQVAHPSIVTVDELGGGEYHIEFKTPLEPRDRGQGRGNSGVYILGRYEVQVLDSFGLPPADNEAGGIYQKAVPKVNASLPPGEWQTYDITFKPAKFDETGRKVEDATITVKHNGILIHDNVRLDSPTPGGVSDTDAEKGPLLLQNHGDSVAYRNIWYLPAPQP
jgi:hypothetical protein